MAVRSGQNVNAVFLKTALIRYAPSGNRLLTTVSRWHMNLRTGVQLQNLTDVACSADSRCPAEVRLEVSWTSRYACYSAEQRPSPPLSRTPSGNDVESELVE